jgi:vancomycin resistance protein YoaR
MNAAPREDISAEGEKQARAPQPLPRAWWLAAAGLIAAGGIYLWSLKSVVTAEGLRLAGQPVGGVPFAELDARVRAVSEQFLDGDVLLKLSGEKWKAKRREVGFVVDRAEVVERLKQAGKSGNPFDDLSLRARAARGRVDLPLSLDVDRPKALEFLTNLKDDLDRAPVDARLDLEHHTVAPERAGYLVRVYDSMVALEYAARAGGNEVELQAATTRPKVGKEELASLDISTVLGHWETHYSAVGPDTDRTYNLKVGADHLNGHILLPHELFSFNDVVGDRTEKEGYRVAPVISGGELIDGLAGGMCQIASTLHAAAFFGGLEIVSSTPHSRPSAYIPMGLDSTVVYPTTDLKLRNPYDFPVVMHYQVNQGSVKVELLGKARPYRVIYEREIKTETAFGTEGRHDPEAPAGQRIVLQEGYPGYSLIRRRYIFDKDDVPKVMGPEPIADLLQKQKKKPIKKEQWALHYPATSLIVAVGTGPKSLKKKPAPPSHHIPPIAPTDKPLWKLLK